MLEQIPLSLFRIEYITIEDSSAKCYEVLDISEK